MISFPFFVSQIRNNFQAAFCTKFSKFNQTGLPNNLG